MRTILPESDNPHLREVAHHILLADIKSARIKKLIAEMKELLSHEEYGVALAAPQVGESIQLFVVSGKALTRDKRNAKDEEKDERPAIPATDIRTDEVYINPELLKISRKKIGKHEGCLSIRGKWGVVPRAEKATVRAYNEHGERFTRGASGFLAHVFQHEMDHLQGILYTDKADSIHDEKSDDD